MGQENHCAFAGIQKSGPHLSCYRISSPPSLSLVTRNCDSTPAIDVPRRCKPTAGSATAQLPASCQAAAVTEQNKAPQRALKRTRITRRWCSPDGQETTRYSASMTSPRGVPCSGRGGQGDMRGSSALSAEGPRPTGRCCKGAARTPPRWTPRPTTKPAIASSAPAAIPPGPRVTAR